MHSDLQSTSASAQGISGCQATSSSNLLSLKVEYVWLSPTNRVVVHGSYVRVVVVVVVLVVVCKRPVEESSTLTLGNGGGGDQEGRGLTVNPWGRWTISLKGNKASGVNNVQDEWTFPIYCYSTKRV